MQTEVRFLSAVVALLMLAATLVSSTRATAAESKTTTISVKGMHCPSCAKKITGKVKAVSGVAEAEADVKAGTISVEPEKDKAPSPKAMWEAVEKAGYTPTKLAGPGGTYTEKPKS